MVMRTMRGVAARRVPGTWWYKVGTLGVALVLPGGLLLLLYLMTRSRTHAAAPVRDPYVEWLRMRAAAEKALGGEEEPLDGPANFLDLERLAQKRCAGR